LASAPSEIVQSQSLTSQTSSVEVLVLIVPVTNIGVTQ